MWYTSVCRFRLTFVPLVAVMLSFSCCAAGCASSPKAKRVSELREVADPLPPEFADGSVSHWRAEPARLADDIDRALTDIHWGRLFVRELAQSSDADPQVRAEGLLDDGRRATIAGWAVGDDEVRVAIRVGLFGDGRQEQLFLDALWKRLRGKPKRMYRGQFELPPAK